MCVCVLCMYECACCVCVCGVCVCVMSTIFVITSWAKQEAGEVFFANRALMELIQRIRADSTMFEK